jgi:asparagine N-glycosylation enzyme membrane subunit Stt3
MALILGAQLAILHFFATKLSLYWEIAWFDNLMHFFGGIVLLFVLHTLTDIRVLSKSWMDKIYKTIILVLAVLLGWEILGIALIGRIKENFITDTSLDVLFGILGSIVGWFIARALTKLDQ